MQKQTESLTKKPSFTERLDMRAGTRNSGIDLLRLLSMFFVVTVHSFTLGGIEKAAQPGTIQFVLSILFEAFTMTCVNTFALISGYVGYTDEKKPARITPMLQLYLQAVTCGVVAAAAFMIARPDLVSLKDFVLPFFPITSNYYWYYTAYVGVLILSPLLNAAVRHTPKRTLRVILIALFAAFSVFTAVVDRFKLEAGYTTFWLILLYLMGGILKKCEIGKKLRSWMVFAGIAALLVVTWLWTMFGFDVSAFGVGIGRKTLLSYTSPTILAASVLYVIGFARLRCGRRLKRFATFVAPCVFAVYLFNANALVYEHLIKGKFAYLATASPFVLVGTVIGFSLAFVVVSVLLDRARILLFDLLGIPQMLAAVDRAAHRLVEKHIPND